jgi:NAD(P)-dependent dehydrogenase (short-subunit alcohol dehydrogenase family)
MLRFDDEVAVITGAGRGLGAAYAKMLAGRGCRVVVNDLREAHGGAPDDPALSVVSGILAAGGSAVADNSSVVTAPQEIIDHAVDAFGRVDLVINNAGILARNPFTAVTPEQLADALAVHVQAALAVTQAAWPRLTEAPAGRVLFTSSGGVFGIPGSIAYSVAKSAIIGLTKTLTLEAGVGGPRVNAVMPAARTRMSTGTPGTDTEQLMAQFFDPAHVAAFVAWLMHADTGISGEIFSVGGGRAARVFLAESAGVVADSGQPESWADAAEALLRPDPYMVPASAFDELRETMSRLGPAAEKAFQQAFTAG